VSRTDLARRTRKALELARRQGAVLVESHGEEQIAILDAPDYRLLRALVLCRHQPPSAGDRLPQGLSQEAVQAAVTGGRDEGVQAAWDLVIDAYMVGEISLGRAAELLGLTRFELAERFNRLGVPLRQGPQSVAEAQADLQTLRG
jgi:predicted HTH domain antitoxin